MSRIDKTSQKGSIKKKPMFTIKEARKSKAGILVTPEDINKKHKLSLFVLWKTKDSFHGVVFCKNIGIGGFNADISKAGFCAKFFWKKSKPQLPEKLLFIPSHLERALHYDIIDRKNKVAVKFKSNFHYLLKFFT